MKVGLLGFGTVGSGVYEILNNSISGIEVTKVLDRDLTKLPITTNNINDIIDDKEIDIVVEAMGGIHPAYEYIIASLKSGKNVVTANKAVVAKYLEEFLKVAKENNVRFLFEASVGGGIPCLASIQKAKRIDKISRIYGILNGTSNFILDAMFKENKEFFDVLKTAQELGYAEADPSADIDGYDVLNKIVIASVLAYDFYIDREVFPVYSMRNISKDDISYLKKNNKMIKYIGESIVKNGKYEAFVMPNIFDITTQEATVPSNFNLVTIFGDTIGELKFYGQGAGKLPTANAIVQDILDIKLNYSNYEIKCNNSLLYSDVELKNRFLLRSYKKLDSELIEKIEEYNGNYYMFTKEISTKNLKTLADNLLKNDEKGLVAKINN